MCVVTFKGPVHEIKTKKLTIAGVAETDLKTLKKYHNSKNNVWLFVFYALILVVFSV